VNGYLQDFLFPPERARSPVKALSGGERNRLLLARLFARPANVLVLDEPTNDLDIETLELLEALLQEYEGTLFLVSHDRRFLDNVVTQTIAAEGEGRWMEYVGGYEDWLRQRPALARPAEPAPSKPPAPEPAARRRNEAKLTYKERKELEALPDRIAGLEAEIANMQERLADPQLYRSQPELARELQSRLPVAEDELEQAMARWVDLESKDQESGGK